MENNKCDVLDTKQRIHKQLKWNEDMCKFFDKKTSNVITHQKLTPPYQTQSMYKFLGQNNFVLIKL
jgi:hypothetical protein